LACERPEENARRLTSDAIVHARLWFVLPTREGRYAEEKSRDAKEKSPLAAVPHMDTAVFPMHAGVFFMDAKEFCMDTKSSQQHASNVCMDTANGMQHGKNVRMDTKESCMDTKDGRMDTKDCRMDTKEFSVLQKKLHIPAKSPGTPTDFLRMEGKFLTQDAGVFPQEDSAAPMPGEIRFIHTFFSCILTGKKSKDVFSFGVMHEEKSKDAFFVGKEHPPAILHTSSAFVPKQGAFVRNPASAVDNDDTVRRTAVVGREAGTADIQKLAMCACYGGGVSQDETGRKNILAFDVFLRPGIAGGPIHHRRTA
jgi:hypothetical protein